MKTSETVIWTAIPVIAITASLLCISCENDLSPLNARSTSTKAAFSKMG